MQDDRELNDRQRIWIAFSVALGIVLAVIALAGCIAAVVIRFVDTTRQFD